MQWFKPTLIGKVAVSLTIAVGLAAVAGPASAQKKVRWKMHSAYGQNLAVLGSVGYDAAESIRKMSDGRFDIKVFEPGALAGGFAYYDSVSTGAFEAAYGTPGANQGKNSAYAFLSSWPFGPGIGEFLAWMKHGGGEEIARELYAKDNIEYHFCGLNAAETSGWFRKEIKSLDDLKGLKMRFFGVGAKVIQKFGVSTQQIAGGDIYPALELGTLDATEFSSPAIDRSYGFHQIAKFNYFPGWHQQATTNEFVVNKDKWDALPESYQEMFRAACNAATTLLIADAEASQFAAMLANEKEGVQNLTWPPEILDQFRSAWDEVVVEEIAGNPDSKRIWDSFSAFHEKYKVWGDRGYLK